MQILQTTLPWNFTYTVESLALLGYKHWSMAQTTCWEQAPLSNITTNNATCSWIFCIHSSKYSTTLPEFKFSLESIECSWLCCHIICCYLNVFLMNFSWPLEWHSSSFATLHHRDCALRTNFFYHSNNVSRCGGGKIIIGTKIGSLIFGLHLDREMDYFLGFYALLLHW